MKEDGIIVPQDYTVKTKAKIQSGYKSGKQLLRLQEKPTAIFACNDLLAIGVMKAAKEEGLNIPEDLSIIGFDNTVLSTTPLPMLTTIAQPIKQMGTRVVEMLVEGMEKPKLCKERLLLTPELIIRQSTCPFHNE